MASTIFRTIGKLFLRLFLFVFSVGWSFASAIAAIYLTFGFRFLRYYSPFKFLLVIVAVHFSLVIVHELAHLAVGVASGLAFKSLVIGQWFALVRRRGRIQLLLGPVYGAGGGGLAALTYQTGDDQEIDRLQLSVLAGPLITLTQGVLGAVAFLLLPADMVWLRLIAIMTALDGIVTALVNLLPISTAGLSSDGGTLLAIWIGGPRTKQLRALLKLEGLSQRGMRPRDYPAEELATVMAVEDTSTNPSAAARLLAYYAALDRGDIPEAQKHFAAFAAAHRTVPPLYRSVLYLEAAFFEARYRNNPRLARAWLTLVKDRGILNDKYSRLRPLAAIALAEGDPQLATILATKAQELSRMEEDRGFAAAECDWLEEIIALAKKQEPVDAYAMQATS